VHSIRGRTLTCFFFADKFLPRSKQSYNNHYIPYREIIAFCLDIPIQYINTLCRQNVEYFDVKLCGMHINHWALSVN